VASINSARSELWDEKFTNGAVASDPIHLVISGVDIDNLIETRASLKERHQANMRYRVKAEEIKKAEALKVIYRNKDAYHGIIVFDTDMKATIMGSSANT
jgi:hypothetical protein